MSTLSDGAYLVAETTKATSSFIPYNNERVKQCFDTINNLYSENQIDIQSQSQDSSSGTHVHSVLVRHTMIEHQKRCLLTYQYSRLQKIMDLRWNFGTVIPRDVRESLTDEELVFFRDYSKILSEYMQKEASDGGGPGSNDLTQFLQPPKSLYVEVRCIKDYGEFETSDGSIVNMNKGSIHLLVREDCEDLVKHGFLIHIF